MYFTLSSKLNLHWLTEQIKLLPRLNTWQRKARTGLLDEVRNELRALSMQMISTTEADKSPTERVSAWLSRNRIGIDHCHTVFDDIRAGGKPELAMLTVAMRELRALYQSTDKEEP